jgi:hypothetical protein
MARIGKSGDEKGPKYRTLNPGAGEMRIEITLIDDAGRRFGRALEPLFDQRHTIPRQLEMVGEHLVRQIESGEVTMRSPPPPQETVGDRTMNPEG